MRNSAIVPSGRAFRPTNPIFWAVHRNQPLSRGMNTMEPILRVLTLYDIMAYLVPGAVVVVAVLYSYDLLFAYHLIPGASAKRWYLSLIVVAYLFGTLIQGWASPIRRERPQNLGANPKPEDVFPRDPGFASALTEKINKAFQNPGKDESFGLCEFYLQTRKLDSFVEIMRARYAFFRGLTYSLPCAALILAVGAVGRLWRRWRRDYPRDWESFFVPLLLAFLCLAGAYTAKIRTNDFNFYYANSVYVTFYADYSVSDTPGGKHP